MQERWFHSNQWTNTLKPTGLHLIGNSVHGNSILSKFKYLKGWLHIIFFTIPYFYWQFWWLTIGFLIPSRRPFMFWITRLLQTFSQRGCGIREMLQRHWNHLLWAQQTLPEYFIGPITEPHKITTVAQITQNEKSETQMLSRLSSMTQQDRTRIGFWAI